MKPIRSSLLLFTLILPAPFLAWGQQQPDPAGPIYNAGDAAYKKGDYTTAAADFNQIIKQFGGSRYSTSARFELGVCYFQLGDYDNAIKTLQPFTDVSQKNEMARSSSMFYIAQAHLGLAKKAISDADKQTEFQKGITGLNEILKDFPTSPLAESILFIRLGAYLDSGNQDQAIVELQAMITKYATSPALVDYQNLLAQLYAAQAFKALQSSSGSGDDDKAIAQKAIDLWKSLDRSDPALNYSVTQNIGNLEFLLASKNPTDLTGFSDNLALFRSMQTFDEAVYSASARNTGLRQAAIRSSGDPTITKRADVADGHLAQLKASGDSGAVVLLREAECLNALQQGDDVRTILHHIAPVVPAADQDEYDKLLLYSYMFSGNAVQVQAGYNAFKAKHGIDSSVDQVEFQAATRLRKAGQFEDALLLCKASLRDFPTGRYATDVLTTATQILTNDLHRPNEVGELTSISKVNTNDPKYLISKAYSLQVQGKFEEALKIYEKVKNDPSAGDLASSALMQMISIHQKLSESKGDASELAKVAALSKEFIQKYPGDKSIPNARLMGDMASDTGSASGDPGSLADLQSLANDPATNEAIATAALFYLVKANERVGNLDEMEKAATNFRTKFPQKTNFLAEITKIQASAYTDKKEYAKAVQAYQAQLTVDDKDIAADAQVKIGDVYMVQARDLHDNSSAPDAEKVLPQAEDAYLAALNNYPDQTRSVASAIDGLMTLANLRVSWGDYKDQKEVGKAFDDYASKVTSPVSKFHLQIARIGCVFTDRDGRPNVGGYPDALNAIKQLIAANPTLELTRQETVAYVQLLASQKQTPEALQLLDALVNKVDAGDYQGQADLDFAYATCYLQQNRWTDAQAALEKMHELPGDALIWYTNGMQLKYDLAYISENTGDQAGALQQYALIMQQADVRYDIHAEALMGAGRIFEKQGKLVSSGDTAKPNDYAAYYYRRIDTVYATGVPELSAEGLVRALQLYLDAKDQTDAQKMFDRLAPYKTLAPKQYGDGLDKAKINGLNIP